MSVIASDIDMNSFPVEVKHKDGKFYVFCKTFNIIKEAPSLNDAYDMLAEARNTLIQKYNDLGIAMPTTVVINARLKKYMMYSLIISILMLPIGLISGSVYVMRKMTTIISSVENNVKNTLYAAINDPRHLTEGLNKLVVVLEKVTPERKEEIQVAVKRIGLFFQPFIAEINSIDFKKNS